MTPSDLQDDIQFLLHNPDKTLGSKYHDAGSCWQLIDEMRALQSERTRLIAFCYARLNELDSSCAIGESAWDDIVDTCPEKRAIERIINDHRLP